MLCVQFPVMFQLCTFSPCFPSRCDWKVVETGVFLPASMSRSRSRCTGAPCKLNIVISNKKVCLIPDVCAAAAQNWCTHRLKIWENDCKKLAIFLSKVYNFWLNYPIWTSEVCMESGSRALSRSASIWLIQRVYNKYTYERSSKIYCPFFKMVTIGMFWKMATFSHICCVISCLIFIPSQ